MPTPPTRGRGLLLGRHLEEWEAGGGGRAGGPLSTGSSHTSPTRGQGEGQLGSGQGSAWVKARVSEGQGEGQLGGLSQGRGRVRGGVGHKCSESSGFSSIPRL